MRNTQQAFKAVSLFICLLAQTLWAAVPVTWIPEMRVAIVNMVRNDLEGARLLEALRTQGPLFDLPEGYFALVVPAGEGARNRDGDIRRTSIYLGEQSTENVTDLIEPLTAAGVPLTSMKGMVFVTCYGGRTLPDGTPSLAKKLADTFSFPVLATTGSFEQTVALNVELYRNGFGVRPSTLAYSPFAVSGPTRVSPWVIETPTFGTVADEQMETLKNAQANLDQMQDAASAVGLIPGDLRTQSLIPVSARVPNVAGLVGSPRLEAATRKEWERFKLNLQHRQVSALVINPQLPELEVGFLEHGIQHVARATAAGNAVVVPVVGRWWFSRQVSLPQYIANTTRQVVFHPGIPENAATLSDADFQKAVDYKNWVAVRPALTQLAYFDDEVDAVKAELAKSLGESKVRPFSKIKWAYCEDRIIGARKSLWSKLLPWNWLRKKY